MTHDRHIPLNIPKVCASRTDRFVTIIYLDSDLLQYLQGYVQGLNCNSIVCLTQQHRSLENE